MLATVIAIATGVALWVLVQIIRNSRASLFAAKVSGALFDLGLQPMKFDTALNKIYVQDCQSYYDANRPNANPHDLAAKFFVKAVMDYPAFVEQAVMFEGFLIRSIHVVKSWHEKKITAAAADNFILKIKTFLLEGLKAQPMEEGIRLATEIQILEL